MSVMWDLSGSESGGSTSKLPNTRQTFFVPWQSTSGLGPLGACRVSTLLVELYGLPPHPCADQPLTLRRELILGSAILQVPTTSEVATPAIHATPAFSFSFPILGRSCLLHLPNCSSNRQVFVFPPCAGCIRISPCRMDLRLKLPRMDQTFLCHPPR